MHPTAAIAILMACSAVCASAQKPSLLDFPMWKRESGLWVGNYTFFGPEGTAQQPTPVQTFPGNPPVTVGFPYRYDQYVGFINITIVGDRFYQHNYFLYPPAPQSFCDQAASKSQKSVLGNGTCGSNGYERGYEAFGAQFRSSPCMVGTRGAGSFGAFTTYTVIMDNQTLVYTTLNATNASNPIMYARQINIIPDPEAKLRYRSQMSFDNSQGFSAKKTTLSDYREMKVASAEEWLELIRKKRAEYNISREDQVQQGQLPMTTPCQMPAMCPTEQQFKDASNFFNEMPPAAMASMCNSAQLYGLNLATRCLPLVLASLSLWGSMLLW